MKKIRTFFALPLPRSWKEGLFEIQSELKGKVRSKAAWVNPHNVHITLRFLGDVAQDELEGICNGVHRLDFPEFEMGASGGGCFPSLVRPRVLWMGLSTGGREVAGLASLLSTELEALGYPKDRKNFHAHLTLARIKNQGGDDWKKILRSMKEYSLPEYRVNHFCLYKSELKPSGAVYTELKRFNLSGAE